MAARSSADRCIGCDDSAAPRHPGRSDRRANGRSVRDVVAWWVWFIVAAAFAISEIFTAGFFLFWFGIGAAVAGVLALVGLSAPWQWIAFIVVSSALAMLSRRFAERFSRPQPDGVGANRLLGPQGIVLEPIDNLRNTGKVRLEKEEWRAESETVNLSRPTPW